MQKIDTKTEFEPVDKSLKAFLEEKDEMKKALCRDQFLNDLGVYIVRVGLTKSATMKEIFKTLYDRFYESKVKEMNELARAFDTITNIMKL